MNDFDAFCYKFYLVNRILYLRLEKIRLTILMKFGQIKVKFHKRKLVKNLDKLLNNNLISLEEYNYFKDKFK